MEKPAPWLWRVIIKHLRTLSYCRTDILVFSAVSSKFPMEITWLPELLQYCVLSPWHFHRCINIIVLPLHGDRGARHLTLHPFAQAFIYAFKTYLFKLRSGFEGEIPFLQTLKTRLHCCRWFQQGNQIFLKILHERKLEIKRWKIKHSEQIIILCVVEIENNLPVTSVSP